MIEKALKVIELTNDDFKQYLDTLTARELEDLRKEYSDLASLSSSKNSLIYHHYRKIFK